MRLSNTVLGSAILAAVALSACTTPGQLSRAEENRRMIDAEFGVVGPRSNPEAFKANGLDGDGFSMFRLYSEKPMPNSFSKSVPEKFDNTLVVDFGIEMQIKDRFPLYRVGMDPTKISQRRIDLWPSHVSIKAAGADGQTRELAARLPETRVPGADGMIWSDWTYCADCFDLEEIRDADVDKADLTGSDLTSAGLYKARMNGIDGTGMKMVDCLGARVKLREAWLDQADLSGSDLANGDLSEAVVTKSTATGLRIARKQVAPDLLVVPVSAPQEAAR